MAGFGRRPLIGTLGDVKSYQRIRYEEGILFPMAGRRIKKVGTKKKTSESR